MFDVTVVQLKGRNYLARVRYQFNGLTEAIGLPGQYYDAESGLHYNYFRDYDPETGRYITSDPIGLIGGVNTYNYADNNPARYSDPLGLFTPLGWRVGATCLAADAAAFAGDISALADALKAYADAQKKMSDLENKAGCENDKKKKLNC